MSRGVPGARVRRDLPRPSRIRNSGRKPINEIDNVTVLNTPRPFDYDLAAGTTDLTFQVNDEPQELHLGVWEMPGPWKKNEIPWGPRYDLVHDTFDVDEHTISVDLPKV